MKITEYTIEKLVDPTGILEGDRYEFYLQFEVPEDDELFSENDIQLKVLFYMNEGKAKMLNYHFYDRTAEEYLDFELEAEEKELISAFCKEHLSME